MPLAQLGVIILWFGWFGFNPGSTLNATNLHFADVVITTNLAAAAGALAAMAAIYRLQKVARRGHDRQRRDRGPGRHHRTERLRAALGGDHHRRRRRA